MADINTTIGADLTALDADLREAVQKQERYARLVKMIDDRVARDAAANMRTIERANAAAETRSLGFLRRFTAASGQGALAFRALGLGALSGAAAVTLASRTIGRSAEAYGREFGFAQQRLEAVRRETAELGRTARRDLFDTFVQGRSAINAVLGTLEAGREAAARFMASFTMVGAVGAAMGGDALFSPGNVRAAEAALDLAERRERDAMSRRAAAPFAAGLDAADAAARGDRLGAEIARLNSETAAALARLAGVAGLRDADRAGLAARIGDDAERRAELLRRNDASERAERAIRARAFAADDGTAAGGLQSRAFAALADAERRGRALLGQDLSADERRAGLMEIRRELDRRIDGLRRELALSREIADIEDRRAEALGLDGEARRAALDTLDDEERRARARAEITDPAALAGALRSIDAGAGARDRDRAAAEAEQASRRAAMLDRARTDAAETLEALRIDRLRASGRTREADEADIRLRFGGIERRFRETLGDDAAPFIEELGRRMAEAIAGAGKDKSAVVSAPTGLGSFGGVMNAVAGDQSRLLQRIEENTRKRVSFTMI